jgi:YggT family protein
MSHALIPILKGASYLLSLYKICMLVYALLSWLYLFGIIQTNNSFFNRLVELLHAIIDPPLSYLRRFVPSPGSLDLSFLVLFIVLQMVSEIVSMILQNLLFNAQFLS